MKKYKRKMTNSQRLCRIHNLIEEYKQISDDFSDLKEGIAEECAEERYPGNGTNYELRLDSRSEFYLDRMDDILQDYIL